jgi:hypothetical protein
LQMLAGCFVGSPFFILLYNNVVLSKINRRFMAIENTEQHRN